MVAGGVIKGVLDSVERDGELPGMTALDGRGHRRAFLLGVALNLAFVAAEAGFGFHARSLALISDAGHNLSDVLGLALAWGAALLALRHPTARHTYGWRASTVLAALANAALLLLAIGAIAWAAVHRLRAPAPVQGGVVMVVAGVGIVINAATALLFRRGRAADLNVRGAFLHMAADAAVSAGVVATGLVIMLTGLAWLDPVVSLAIVVVIAIGTWRLLRDSVNLALHAVPAGMDLGSVAAYLGALPGVVSVHDLHLWSVSTTEVAFTGHIVKPAVEDDDALLARACRELRERFGIGHATLQVERNAEHFCSLAARAAHDTAAPRGG